MGETIVIVVLVALFLGRGSLSRWSPLEGSRYASMRKYWEAVSVLETGNFSSPVYVNGHNMFGMHKPLVRQSTSNGSMPCDGGSVCATYSSDRDSVQDIVMYMDSMSYPTQFASLYQMIQFMKSKGYFGISADAYYARVLAAAALQNLDVGPTPNAIAKSSSTVVETKELY